VASTAYGFRTPLVLAPVKAASAGGVQPAVSAAVTAGASLARWVAVSGEEPAHRLTAASRPGQRVGRDLARVRAGGGFHGRF
jgi:hypothetical protein